MEAEVVVMWGHGAQVQAAYRSWKGGNGLSPGASRRNPASSTP